ncbi:MAG: hypothetical protein RLZZ399_1279 [Verrucomicrobiota bacterium]|jgi:hypothetical protein
MKLPPLVGFAGMALQVLASDAQSDAQATPESRSPTLLEEVVVSGKRSDLLGIAPSASEGTASGEELRARPLLRRGEVLETVPGMVVTQHSGGGKANQYFLRGFNLDHGTDFALSLDGMPLNMRTHAHGQGYADLNLLIPELIERVDYFKGTYAARNGDLSSAGSSDFCLYNVLPNAFGSVEIGQWGYLRGVAGDTFATGLVADSGKLTLAGEYNQYDGPWLLPENFRRWNGFSRYFKGDSDDYLALTLMGYRGTWQSSDQIPLRAVESGVLDRFGNLDPTNGGQSSRYSLQLDWQQREAESTTRLNLYAIRYALDLYSNFTYATDPARGDQFEQAERRLVLGGSLSRKWEGLSWLGKPTDWVIGLQTRTDLIDGMGLYQTTQRARWKTVREDDVFQSSAGVYGENTVHWLSWFKTIAGLRADTFLFDVNSRTPGNSGSELATILSPKFTAVLGPWKKTEFYANFGTGFHSNDARGVNTTTEPSSGNPVVKVSPLVRTMGGELGLRSQLVPKVTAGLSLWYLHSQSELVYVGDAGTNEAGPGSRRYGVEGTVYWGPSDWLGVDGEIAVSHARFTNGSGEGRIPGSVPWMFSGGFVLGAQGQKPGWFGGARARIFGRRPLTEDGSVKGRETVTLNASAGYRTARWEGAVECLNVLDRKDRDIEYFYSSQMRSEATPVDGIHFHPAEPRMFRARVTYKF